MLQEQAGVKRSRLHYAWIITALSFVVLLVTAGVRTAPGVFIVPLESEFGWTRGGISLAVAVSLLTFGLGGPIAGSLIDRFGPRRIMLWGLVIIALGLAPMLAMRELWHLHLLWGIIIGIGTGAVGNVLGATIAMRWFKTRRGLIVGLFGAASSAGQLVFLPSLMSLTSEYGWRAGIGAITASIAVLVLPAALLMRNTPQDVGTRPFGDDGTVDLAHQAAEARTTPLREAVRTRDFWLLAGSFFICGYTSNGLIGTHLIPHALEHGFTEVAAAGAVGLMGMMNIIGTLGSGWLTDRYDNRRLLAMYYGFRALAIAQLPFIVEMNGLVIFAVLYGLDWIATVPPTVNLTAQRFGRGSLGTIYGWIYCSHMIGAALAAFAGGFFHDLLGDYTVVFFSAAALGFIAVALSLTITKQERPVPVPVEA
jgi:MFS family permease